MWSRLAFYLCHYGKYVNILQFYIDLLEMLNIYGLIIKCIIELVI